MSETNSGTPAIMILSMFPMTAFTIPEIICGIACTMVVMICGNAWIRAVSYTHLS